MKTLVIVGNAPIPHDFSKIIDCAALVIRFNGCGSYKAGNTGQKADILVIRGGINDAENIRNLNLNEAVIEKVREIWFKRPDMTEFNRAVISAYKLEGKKIRYIRESLTYDLIQRMRGDSRTRVLGIPPSQIKERAHPQYIDPVTQLYSIPSAGMAAIETVLVEPEYADYEKLIVGFTWRGLKMHPWDAERLLCEDYIKQGRIKLLYSQGTSDNPAA